MRLPVDGVLMRLLVSGCFNFDFGRGIVKLALELIPGLLEFPQALAKSTGKLGKLFCPEEQYPVMYSARGDALRRAAATRPEVNPRSQPRPAPIVRFHTHWWSSSGIQQGSGILFLNAFHPLLLVND